MGAACCTASGDGYTIASTGTAIRRHSHHSPSWSFRWDNRVRVAGQETTLESIDRGGCGNDPMEVKSLTTAEATFASDDGSPSDSFRAFTWHKSPDEENVRSLMLPSDPATSCYLPEVKEPIGSPSVSYPSPSKQSPSVPSVSSPPEPLLFFQSHLRPGNATPSRQRHRSPPHPFLRQVSDSQVLEYRSPSFSTSKEPSSFLLPAWCNESTRGSNGGSSDSWSIPAFRELSASRKERWSFDSGTSSFSHDKITRNSRHKSGSSSFDLRTCYLCSSLLVERPSWRWNTQKEIISNETDAVAVLSCGHVFHGECLEYLTPEIHKYDPICPICTCTGKSAAKMPSIDVSLDPFSPWVLDGKRASKIVSSATTKSSTVTPFLRRHFSFGSGTSRSMPINYHPAPRRGFFWAKSSKS